MRSSEGERLCQEAQVYYYDLLCQEEAAVPAVVRRHVATCPACQEEMGRLRGALFEAQRPARAADTWQDETIEALAQQFQLLDQRVTCSEAKPLLAELALASPRIRIPTPVTVHVDHCPQCAGDLAAIRNLHLTADQLRRLGRFLETGRAASANRGWEASDTGDGLAPATPGSLSGENDGVACNEIAMADLFDGVVPSGATPRAGETTSERQKAIMRHVRSCPVCLEKARTLDRTIGEIVARANSEIVTVYRADNDAEGAFPEAEGGYPYPVSVQVLRRPSDATMEAHAAPAAGLCALRRSAKPLAALAALVFVVIVPAWLLRTTGSTASGTDVSDVDKALAGVKNVHIVTRDREDRLVQEFRIARGSRVLVDTTANRCVLYDLAHNRQRTIESQTGPGASTPTRLSKVEAEEVRQLMASCVRHVLTGISPDTKLRPATGEIDGGVQKGLDVYELPSSSRARTSPVRDRWLVYLDPATGLPQRMEFYRQRLGQDRGDPVTTTIFTYPTEQEMDAAIEALFPAP